MQLTVTVNGVAYDVEVQVEEEPQSTLGAIFMSGGSFAPPRAQVVAASSDGVQAPLSGTVARVLVEEGQDIEEGDVVVVLEAMKMETEITAPRGGTVSAVLVSAGDSVSGGQTLVEVA